MNKSKLVNKAAKHIFGRLDQDIRDRKGLDGEWSMVDDDIMNGELKPEWESIFKEEIASLLLSLNKRNKS